VSAGWFDGVGVVPITKRGSRCERDRARLGAANMVCRNNGTPHDLKHVLDLLDLWPAADPAG
jgi:hypothetical protein